MEYISQAHLRAYRDAKGLDPRFVAHLKKLAKPIQNCYQKVMDAGNGNPVGIEMKSTSREAWAVVLEEMSSAKSTHRIQYFDESGFSGHYCFSNVEEAMESVIREGFSIMDVGALDRVSCTEKWSLGMYFNELRMLVNSGQISWEEMLKRASAVKSSQEPCLT